MTDSSDLDVAATHESAGFFADMSAAMKGTLAVLFVVFGLSLWSLLGGGGSSDSGEGSGLAVHAASFAADRENAKLALDHDALRRLGIESPARITAIPIRDIRVGMRVPAMNPQVTDTERAAFDLSIDPATWRKFTLEVVKHDGSGRVTVTLIRPSSWLVEESAVTDLALLEIALEEAGANADEQELTNNPLGNAALSWVELASGLTSTNNALVSVGNVAISRLSEFIIAENQLDQAFAESIVDVQSGAGVGDWLWLNMPELGAVGLAKVVANDPCPNVPNGPGQVVTATFVHESADVLDLTFRGAESRDTVTLGVTTMHPFWSELRKEFVAAGKLTLGEEMLALNGQRTYLASISPRAGPEAVYNFEVACEHVYYVSRDGLLVHNWCVRSLSERMADFKKYVLDGAKGASKSLSNQMRRAKRLFGESHHFASNICRKAIRYIL